MGISERFFEEGLIKIEKKTKKRQENRKKKKKTKMVDIMPTLGHIIKYRKIATRIEKICEVNKHEKGW